MGGMGASGERHRCPGVRIQRIVNDKTIKCIIDTYFKRTKDIGAQVYLFYKKDILRSHTFLVDLIFTFLTIFIINFPHPDIYGSEQSKKIDSTRK